MINISAHEQEKIGIELHDNLGQKLTGISLLTRNLKQQIDQESIELQQSIDQILAQLSKAIGDIRNICHGLAPLTLSPQGLPYALKNLLESSIHNNEKLKFKVVKRFSVKDRITALQLYRIAQEALNNTLKHAQAKQISLALTMEKDKPQLVLLDDGLGFDLETKKAQSGIGLKIMEYRAAAISARLSIISSPGNGTKVTCTLI